MPVVLRLLVLAVLLRSGTTQQVAAAQDSELAIVSVSIGLAGYYKVGRWTPITVEVRGAPAAPIRLAVQVTDPDGNLTVQPAREVILPGGQGELHGLFMAGRLDGVVHVQIESHDRVLAEQILRSATTGDHTTRKIHPLTQTTQIWIVAGQAEEFSTAAESLNVRDSRDASTPAVVVVPISTLDELPPTAMGMSAADVLVVTHAEHITRDDSQLLRQWVTYGGHMVLVSALPQDLAASSLMEWVPARVLGESRLRDLSGLTRLIPGHQSLRVSTVGALRFEYDAGETLASGLDGPVLARLPLGFGRITLLGLDLSRPPLSTWSGTSSLCELLADYQKRDGRGPSGSSIGRSQSGVSDIQTQLAAAIDQFPSVGKPSTRQVMGYMLIYLLIIGVLDYVIIHRWLRRPLWTWLTFPLLVLLTAGVAINYAHTHSPAGVSANQVEIIDADLESGALRSRSWMTFLSPETRRYAVETLPGNELRYDPAGLASLHHLTWTGIPETGFRGMYRTGGLELPKPSYSFTPDGTGIEDLPVAIRSTGSVSSYWYNQLLPDEQIVTVNLKDNFGQLAGTVTNNLPVPISDWIVVHANRVYRPSESSLDPAVHRIAPGETLALNDRHKVIPRVLKGYLTGVRRTNITRSGRVGDNVVAELEVYDSQDRDPLRIVRTLSFFKSAGGRSYTGIGNNALSSLDLSPLLHLDRAVLFGRVELSAQEFHIDQVTPDLLDQQVFVRVLLPVERVTAPTGIRLSPREELP